MPKTGGRTKKRGVKKGGYYSFSGDVGVPGGVNWTRHSEMGEYSISSRGGNTHYGSGRKRKGKKGKKTRKVKRGGGSFAQAVSGFTGKGTERGLGGFQDVSSPMGKAAGGDFNNHGGKPGDFSNFITTSK
jgi:hypothetical protein